VVVWLRRLRTQHYESRHWAGCVRSHSRQGFLRGVPRRT
jgi:hypothetical protein